MKINVQTIMTNEQAENLVKLSESDIGNVKYSTILRIAFDYYCENNPSAVEKLKEKGEK